MKNHPLHLAIENQLERRVLDADESAIDQPLDIRGNRSAQKYSTREQWLRVAWSFGCWLIKLSPRPFFG
jgi:hypothetical protein